MKVVIRILIVTFCFIVLYVFSGGSISENEVLEGPSQPIQPIPKEAIDSPNVGEKPARPEVGISLYIGKSSEELVEKFSLPTRIDPSKYGFEWWVYERDTGIFMVSVKEGIVTQVYTNDSILTTGPYQIGQSLDDIYRMTIIEFEIAVKLEESIYLFSMSEQDINNRLLIEFEGVYAQLYIDEETNELYAIRYLDGPSLVEQQPYEMQYIGELLPTETVSSFEQVKINEAEAKQLSDLTNAIRQQYMVEPLAISAILSEASAAHSEDMLLENYVSHDSPTYGSLKKRLQQDEWEYEKAGENLATNYTDTMEVMHGWLNSSDHRKELLEEQYTHMGVGVFVGYYTQIFTQSTKKYEKN